MVEIKVGMKAIIANSKNYAEYNFQMCEIKEIENAKRIQVELHDDEFITNFYVQANEIIPILYENPEDLKKWGTTIDDIAKLFSEYKGYYDLICKVAEDISRESDRKEKKYEKQIEDRKYQVEELKNHIDKLKADLEEAQCNKFELLSEPIKVADTLIYSTEKRINPFTQKEYDGDKYSVSDLRQIAEHLLVYCNNQEDE